MKFGRYVNVRMRLYVNSWGLVAGGHMDSRRCVHTTMFICDDMMIWEPLHTTRRAASALPYREGEGENKFLRILGFSPQVTCTGGGIWYNAGVTSGIAHR